MSRTPRPDPLYAGPRQAQRNQNDARSPFVQNGAPPRANGRGLDIEDNTQSRAARFEDEKRRIIESVFAKRDDDGVQVESYITHVRVIEDSMHPVSPPPPNADPSNKKSRVILVAVRRSGRVRLHKARENPNSTFSIGKTWNLDELGSIQSYTNLIARSDQEELEKEWANGMGFIVTLGKAYYWQAPTAKEKDFFIASLVKIYRKYTGGKVPELYGFSDEEVRTLTGVASPQPAAVSAKNTPLATPSPITDAPPIPPTSDRRPQSPYSSRHQVNDTSREPASRLRSQSRNEPRPRDLDTGPPPPEPLRSPARGRYSAGVEQEPPSQPAPLFSSTTRPSPSPQSSQTSLAQSDRPSVTPLNGLSSRPKPPFAESTRDTASLQSTSSRPSTAKSDHKSFDQTPEKFFPPEDQLPERRRPFQGTTENRPSSRSNRNENSDNSFAASSVPASKFPKEAPPTINSAIDDKPPPLNVTNSRDQSAGDVTPSSAVKSPETITSAGISETSSPLSPESSLNKDEYRPGLGPMIKKKSAKDIAGQFRKAALAAGAFQPRQGGGAARLRALQEKEKGLGEPDGITGVVPAPLARGLPSTPLQSTFDIPPTPTFPKQIPELQIQRSNTDDSMLNAAEPPSEASTPQPAASKDPVIIQKPTIEKPLPETAKVEKRPPSPDKARSRSPQRRKRQRQQAEIAKYCNSLGIDSRIFDGRGAEFNELLSEFGWTGRLIDDRKLDDFEAEIKREIGRAQATGWLGHVEQQESKVQDLSKAFDKAIEECEELDGLFTLYSHELDTLAADIEYIEAQSQGLQVQTANQKLLQTELQNLLETLTIPASELRGIKMGSLDHSDGVSQIEKSLALLYKALITIDPDIRQNKIRQADGTAPERSGVGVYADTEIGQMRAVREKKDDYREETMSFVRRFNQHMTRMFKQIEQRTNDDGNRGTMASTRSLDGAAQHGGRQELWTYNALMLFVREVNSYEWQTLITSYEITMKGTYQDQFRDFAMMRRKTAHKPTGEEMDVLFTTQEKEKADEGLASTAATAARKLTVRRGKNPRSGNLKQGTSERKDGRPDAWEVFNGVLEHQTRTIAEEQNFIVHFFHLNSQTNVDFGEIVSTKTPGERRLPNLSAKQSYDPDRDLANQVYGAVESIFYFWSMDLQNLMEWTLSLDQLQGVGILFALEQCLSAYEDTNQEYITRTTRTLHDRLVGMFHKVVDEQIRAIEETKVKVKKRKGIISFMRTFPLFSTAIEHMIPVDTPGYDSLEVRFIVNESYQKILKAMWESLNFIAKDDPSGTTGIAHSAAPSSGDPEDKEALNYHILLIENMGHYIDEVATHQNPILEEWFDRAGKDMALHLGQYVDAIIRRPLGKWLEFVESTEAMMKNHESLAGLSNKPSHSRSAAKKVLSAHDIKEIRKGVETLKKRVEKHFGDVDEPSAASRSLVAKVFDECNYRYTTAWDRMHSIIDQLYEGNLDIDWKKEEVSALLKSR